MNRPKHIALAILAALYALSAPIFAQSTRPLLIDASGTNKGKMEPIAITANSGTDADQFANGATTQAKIDGAATDARIFYDNFSRADTPDSAITAAPTGQTWQVNGSGSANGRILNRTLTAVSPYGTQYYWPTLAFTPRKFGIRFSLPAVASGTATAVCAMGMTNEALSVADGMIHFLWNNQNWGIEYWPDDGQGPTNKVNLVSESFPTSLTPGVDYTFEIEVIPDSDMVIVSSPTGLKFSATHAGISDFATPNIFFEQSANNIPVFNMQIKSVWAVSDASPNNQIMAFINADRMSPMPNLLTPSTKADSGANTDISSLRGLTTSVTVSSGTNAQLRASSDTSSGIQFLGSGQFSLIGSGSERLRVGPGVFTGTSSASTPAFGIIGDANTGVHSTGADTIGLTAGGTNRISATINGVRMTIPTGTSGLSSGDVWNDGGTLKIIP